MSDTMMVQAAGYMETPLLPVQVTARMARIQSVMREVMQEGIDFGKIPGTDKPTIFKPGAEKLAVTFHLATGDPVVTDLGDGYERRYRVSVPILASTGVVLAVGVGECSSEEDKYAWRRPNHQKEYDAAPADRRRVKYQRNGEEWQQVRTNPADVSNTILKMAHKRAYIHGVVMATGAGSVFGQDLEDLEAGVREAVTTHEGAAKPAMRAPQRKSDPVKASGGPATVVDVLRKDGPEKNGKPEWVMWRVKLSDGREATTFNEGIGLVANALKQSGAPCEMTTEPGKKAGSINIVELKAAEREPGSDDQ